MLAVEEILCELERDEMRDRGGLPPGFRFHPTDEELVALYLCSKVVNGGFRGFDIAEVDLNRCEPWELPDAAKMGEREWYFFSLRDRKYPTGLRTNRATGAGYWKATGKDRHVYAAGNASASVVIGMKKTLVFYRGRAPRGEKTKWVMHEYRLDGDFACRVTGKEEWVICRIFHKTSDRKPPSPQCHHPQLIPDLRMINPPPHKSPDQFLLLQPQDSLLREIICQTPAFFPEPALKDLSTSVAKKCKRELHLQLPIPPQCFGRPVPVWEDGLVDQGTPSPFGLGIVSVTSVPPGAAADNHGAEAMTSPGAGFRAW